MKEKNLNNTDNHAPLLRTSYFRFYEELNDFLPEERKKSSFPFLFTGTPSVKNTIEAIGVPHAEIDLILVNGESVDFDFLLKGGENISVYPVFETFDISPVVRLRAQPLRKIQFVVDVNLGKLARKLRLLGFDTLFQNNFEDDEIVEIAAREKRIILTRDKGVLKHTRVTHGYWLRSSEPKLQLQEVISRFQLQHHFHPFSRCSNCNGNLKPVEKKELNGRVPEDTIQIFDAFWECSGCKNIYWEGSHFDRINQWLDKLNGK
ncbi:MAG: Mut7-C ubiquitin/RNAse domain-containing protein [Prolixibacteraceae bacterium]|nr:Mut7-C ubiquitin/RNAse domain-containing protein [Prolixibacteraceae bacterium]